MPRKNKGPYLEQNEFGVWEIRWTLKGRSKRASTGTGDLAEAQPILAEFLSGARKLQGVAYPIAKIVAAYEASHLDDEESDVAAPERAKYAFKNIIEHFGALNAPDVDHAHCKDYAKKRRAGKIGRPVSDTTINYEITMLSAAVNYCVENAALIDATGAKAKLPKASTPSLWRPQKALRRDSWVKPEEYYEIMRSVPVRTKGTKGSRKQFTRVFLYLMIDFNTAARKGAIEALRWDTQVDFANRLIDFNPPGRRQTAKKRPIVPMNRKLYAVLWKAYQERDPKDPHVLPGGGAIRHAFDTAMENAGFGWVTPHVIRHTWITWAYRRGKTKYEVADVTGDDPETLEKHYRHHRPGWLQEAVSGGAAEVMDRGGNGALRPDLGASHGQSDGQRKGSSRAPLREPLS